MGFLDLPGLQYFYNKYVKGLKSHAFRDPANNLTTTESGYALDARQGKALNDKITQINSALTATINTTYGAIIRKIGNTKMIFISNSEGINTSDALDFSFSESFPELFPTMSLSKWVILRDNVTAYLEITANGHVKLSHISGNIPKGTWITICEVYF